MADDFDYGPESYGTSGDGNADPAIIGTPAWWIKRLWKKLYDRQRAYRLYGDYYDGNHRLAFATEKFRQRFGNLFKNYADNWCDLVVDATEERLNVQGFRVPDDGRPALALPRVTQPSGDTDAWEIWQRNNLDLFSQIAHSLSLQKSESAAMVWYGDGEWPVVTIEEPTQLAIETEPSSLTVRAALKRWRDDSDLVFCNVYLPDFIWKFRSDRKVNINGTVPTEVRWVPRVEDNEPWPLPNPLEVVPVVPLYNRPRIEAPGLRGDSEIRQVIPTQDAVNKLIADMLIASEFQSFRQRVVTGIELPRDPETNEVLEDFYKQMIEKVWLFEGSEARVFELGQVDLSGYTAAVELTVQHIASRTRTPPHYFYLSGQFPSGESIKSAETGLVKKTIRKQVFYGEAWERVIRLAFAVMGDARSGAYNMETIWGDPESHRESELADALNKRRDIGVPEEQLWEDAGYSPQQIERFKKMRQEEPSVTAHEMPVGAGVVGGNGQQGGGQGGGQ